MNPKNSKTDSGNYVNGMYTTKNGYTGSGLNCPKGTRLYNPDIIKPVFFMPENRGTTEDFEMITQEVCPGILPYYAVSNYGRVMNINSGKIMKENFRPNGYGYYCLAAEGCKNGQKKFNTNRIVMQTFDPREDVEKLRVNHINGNKSESYINKTMKDGTIQTNVEWHPVKEKDVVPKAPIETGTFTREQIYDIRNLRNQGYSYGMINRFYPDSSYATIQAICRNVIYKDSEYSPAVINPYENVENSQLKISDKDADHIRQLAAQGLKHKEIVEKFYPNISTSTVSDIVRRISHNR